jgi:hypothetical protein
MAKKNTPPAAVTKSAKASAKAPAVAAPAADAPKAGRGRPKGSGKKDAC